MALVSYDYESASGSEDEEDESSAVIIPPPKPNILENEPIKEKSPEPPGSSNLFAKLPESKIIVSDIVEDQIEDFIPKCKPEKQKVRITIPSLSQFDHKEDDEPEHKKAKPLNKGSTLLSLLPPVKGTVMTNKSFVPNSVAQKKKSAPGSLVPHAVRKKAEAKKKAALEKATKPKAPVGSDVETDDEEMEIPETYDDDMWEKVCGRPKPKPVVKEPEEFIPMEINIAPEPEKPYDGLDNTAFKELVGKTKRPIGNIKLIDINEEEILLEKDIWMTKALTDPEMEPKQEEEEVVDPTRRKRNHITHLAQKAKASEQELKNQWGASRNNRLQTRAKYGF
ncbi:unnamed protein product [Brassicogethes aeneus]|uniref:Proline-rich protein PRCC n=1 Tax=Brassicogethes aeneus TaxID=1431903 RepID=A0A9P0ARK6_BRAAE|nr:unnamed protein product [Brassicogethes aeneus]